MAFVTLVQMALLENWLEVTRVTFIAWAMLAVCLKEFDSRDERDEITFDRRRAGATADSRGHGLDSSLVLRNPVLREHFEVDISTRATIAPDGMSAPGT